MDRLFYDELKRVIGEIATDEFDRAKARKVIGACELVMKYAIAAREYGLLKLEDEIVNLNKYSMEKWLYELIILVLDGTDHENVEDIGWSSFFSQGFSSYEGLTYLIYLKGALIIQFGDCWGIAEKKLKSMLPEEILAMVPNTMEEEPFAD